MSLYKTKRRTDAPALRGGGGRNVRGAGLHARDVGASRSRAERGGRAEKPGRYTLESFCPGTPRFDRRDLEKLLSIDHGDYAKEKRWDAPRAPVAGEGVYRAGTAPPPTEQWEVAGHARRHVLTVRGSRHQETVSHSLT